MSRKETLDFCTVMSHFTSKKNNHGPAIDWEFVNTFQGTGWICSQLGAREHYSLARTLHAHGLLRLLITDAWVHPTSILGRFRLPQLTRLRERFHSDLASAQVVHFTHSSLWAETRWRTTSLGAWNCNIQRNQWFQRHAL